MRTQVMFVSTSNSLFVRNKSVVIFLFNQPVDGVMYTIVLPKEWVRDHMIPFYAYRKTNEYSYKSGGVYVFYILKVEEILKFNN